MIRLAAASTACLALGVVPFAATAGVTFVGYGVALPPYERLVTDFSTSAGLTGGSLVTGSVVNQYIAPAYSATTFDTAQYLAVLGGASATLTLKPATEVSIYVGSLDSWNTIAFGGPGGITYTGSQLGAISGSDDGDTTARDTNGRFIFTFSNPVSSIIFSSSQNTLEVASVGYLRNGLAVGGPIGAPEPASWALMLIGFGGLGGALRATHRRTVASV